LKLQKRLNRKVGNKEYSKWVVVLPENKISNLGWKEGVDLEVNITRKGTLELKSKDKNVGIQ
jgi:hypothetical protein